MARRKSKKGQAKRILVRVGLGAAGIVAAPFLYSWIGAFITSDPFVGLYKHKSEMLDDSIGIRMDGVELRDYNGGKLTSSAMANRVDVQRDRHSAKLYGVREGLFVGDNGPIHYAASKAFWNFQLRQVNATGKVSVSNKDFDLTAKDFSLDDRSNLLKVRGDVTGRMYKGIVTASTLVYDTKSGAASAGPVKWSGKLDLAEQDENMVKPHKWNLLSGNYKTLGHNSDIEIYTDASISDEDLILSAPMIEHNRKTDVMTASGGIEYYSGKADIKADKCVIYRKDKRVVLTGHVIMYVKPKAQENDPPKIEKLPEYKPIAPEKVVVTHEDKPVDKDKQKQVEDELRSSKNLREFPLVVVSTQTEYWYAKGDRHAIISGAPQGRQALQGNEWRHVWANHAFYDGEKETLKLISSTEKKDALMKNSLGDELMAVDILVSTKEDDDFVEATKSEGWIYSTQDEVPRDEKKTAPPTTKGSGTGAGAGTTGTKTGG